MLQAFNLGVQAEAFPYHVVAHISHEATESSDIDEETEIGFILGDDDPEDEFVVEVFYDEMYGTIIFDAISGQSKCPHESGTTAVEDPSLIILERPSENVGPEEDMVFEIQITNMGVGKESLFVLYVQQRDNNDGLEVFLDGSPFVESREFSNIARDVSYKKTLLVKRGPTKYHYD